MYYYASKKLFFRGLAAVALVLTTCPSGVASTTVAPLGEEEYYYDDHIETTFAPFDDDNINSFQPWINYGPDGEYNSDDGMYMDGGYDYGLYHDGGNYTTPSPMYGYDDGGWVATTGEYIDECGRLCAAFTAANRGNGYDLCVNSTSHCQYSVSRGQRLCSSLYWELLEDGSGNRGLIFETNEAALTASNDPLTCDEAELILPGPLAHRLLHEFDDDQNPLIRSPSPSPAPYHAADLAIHLFINSAPIARLLAAENETIWHTLARTAASGGISQEIRDRFCYRYGRELTVLEALGQLVSVMRNMQPSATRGQFENVFSFMSSPFFDQMEDDERLALIQIEPIVATTGNRTHEVVVQLQDAFLESCTREALLRDLLQNSPTTLDIPPIRITPSEVMAIDLNLENVESTTTFSIPQVLNISGMYGARDLPHNLYRLYALVSGYDTTEAIIRINDQWYQSINGTNLTLTDSPFDEIGGGSFVTNTANLVLYEQM